jgi:hypothetical protein
VIAVFSPTQLGGYARALDRAGNAGAIAAAAHALLLPNASVLVLSSSMGATTSLSIGSEGGLALTPGSVGADGAAGGFVLAVLGAGRTDAVRFPWWFAGVYLVPVAATVLGGRSAASDATSFMERTIRGAASGVVYAALCGVAVWAASIRFPAWWIGGESVSVSAPVVAVGALALAWGVLGGAAGGAIRRPSPLSAGPE